MEEDEEWDYKVVGRPLHYQPIEPEPTIRKRESIDSNVVEEVLALRAGNLLFEDDLEHVDCIFARFELNKSESLKHLFRGTDSALMLALGLCLYIYIGSYAFVLVSIFYAYKTSDYLWQKHRKLKQLKRLMSLIQSNFSLLSKVMKFVYENENMLKARFGGKHSQRTFDVFQNLKSDFVGLQREINNIFSDATSTLLMDLPLNGYMESPDCYISKRMSDFWGETSVSKLHNVYMLLQSQFLARLIFSLVPNLVAKPELSYNIINKVIVRVTVRLREIQATLNRKFEFALLNGILVESEKLARPLPQKHRQTIVTAEMLATNVHDLSNSLQFSLIKARELEASLEGDIEGNDALDPETELTAIQSELVSCQDHIRDMLILNSKYRNTKENTEVKVEPVAVDSEDIPQTEIGYPDLEPEVDDDIFEAFTGDVPDSRDEMEWERDDDVDPLAKKKQKQMMRELKTRLKQQAEDWARRESMVIARKGLPPRVDEPITNLFEEVESDDGLRFKLRRRKIERYSCGDSSSDEDGRGVQSSSCASLVIEALLERQGHIVTNIADEDSFCCSGENSDMES